MEIHDVFLHRHESAGVRGYRYDATCEGITIATSRAPEHAACRALLSEGITGLVRFWREGKPCHDSSMDIERGARGATQELAKGGIRTVRYVENTFRGGAVTIAELSAAALSKLEQEKPETPRSILAMAKTVIEDLDRAIFGR